MSHPARKPYSRRPWTPAEVATLTRDYATLGGPAVAKALGRPLRSVYHKVHSLGLVHQPRTITDAAFRRTITEAHAAGLTDPEIAGRIGCERHTVASHRRAMGLPSNRVHARNRARVAAKTRQQVRSAGLASLAEVRATAFRRFAASAGWPADLSPREVHILDALDARGALTRPEIAGAIGLPWRGTRNSLKCKGPHGTYLARLIARGLVLDLGRIVREGGKGRNRHLYTLAITAERSVERA